MLPEELGEEERALAEGIRAFTNREVLPRSDRLEAEQTVLAGLADLALELFALDTAIARTQASRGALHEALLHVGVEAARGRALATLARLGPALLGVGGVRDLLAPLAAGAGDTAEARDEVARVLLDRGGLP